MKEAKRSYSIDMDHQVFQIEKTLKWLDRKLHEKQGPDANRKMCNWVMKELTPFMGPANARKTVLDAYWEAQLVVNGATRAEVHSDKQQELLLANMSPCDECGTTPCSPTYGCID